MTRNLKMEETAKMQIMVPRGAMVWRLCKHLQAPSRPAGLPRNEGLEESAKRAHLEVHQRQDRLALNLKLSIHWRKILIKQWWSRVSRVRILKILPRASLCHRKLRPQRKTTCGTLKLEGKAPSKKTLLCTLGTTSCCQIRSSPLTSRSHLIRALMHCRFSTL